MLATATASLVLLAIIVSGGLGAWAVMVPLFVIVSSFAFALPNATALALADHPEVAGAASALLGVIQFMSGAVVAPLVGVAGTDTAVPMALVMSVLGVAGVAVTADPRPRARRGERRMTLVTLAASYGAGGSRIAPDVAERLGVPLLDRARPVLADRARRAARRAGRRGDVRPAAAVDRRRPRALLGHPGGYHPRRLLPDDDERRATEQAVRERAADAGEGVILGRAATVLLRDDPRVAARPPGRAGRARACAAPRSWRGSTRRRHAGGWSSPTAPATRTSTRSTASTPALPGLYALIVDATAMSLVDCAELVAHAARAWQERQSA